MFYLLLRASILFLANEISKKNNRHKQTLLLYFQFQQLLRCLKSWFSRCLNLIVVLKQTWKHFQVYQYLYIHHSAITSNLYLFLTLLQKDCLDPNIGCTFMLNHLSSSAILRSMQ